MVAEFLDTPHSDKWVLCIVTFYLESDANGTSRSSLVPVSGLYRAGSLYFFGHFFLETSHHTMKLLKKKKKPLGAGEGGM